MADNYIVNNDAVTIDDLARTWVENFPRFSSAPWPGITPGFEQEEDVYLVNLAYSEQIPPNHPMLIFPVKKHPGGAIYKEALKLADANFVSVTAALPDEARRYAAYRLSETMEMTGLSVSQAIIDQLKMQVETVAKFAILAKADERQVAYGVILRPDVVDSQQHVYSATEVQKAAYWYMVNKAGTADWLHERTLERTEAVLVESFIAWQDMDYNGFELKKGDWVGGMYVADKEMWQAVKSGGIKSFSIKGIGMLRKLPGQVGV